MWAELLQECPDEAPAGEVGCLVTLVDGIADLFVRPESKRPAGYEVWTRIPMRCCETCARTLTNRQLREVLRRHPVTAGVLDKYPEMRVWHKK